MVSFWIGIGIRLGFLLNEQKKQKQSMPKNKRAANGERKKRNNVYKADRKISEHVNG